MSAELNGGSIAGIAGMLRDWSEGHGHGWLRTEKPCTALALLLLLLCLHKVLGSNPVV